MPVPARNTIFLSTSVSSVHRNTVVDVGSPRVDANADAPIVTVAGDRRRRPDGEISRRRTGMITGRTGDRCRTASNRARISGPPSPRRCTTTATAASARPPTTASCTGHRRRPPAARRRPRPPRPQPPPTRDHGPGAGGSR